jgi:hypothetical protein
MGIRHESSALFDSLPASSNSGYRLAANKARVWKDTMMEAT